MDIGRPPRARIVAALKEGLGLYGYSLADLTAGCHECPHPQHWPYERLRNFLVALLLVDIAIRATGRVPTITSAYRCAECNDRRGGTPRSRHLGGDEGGKPYAAFDLEWSSWSDLSPLFEWLQRDGPGELGRIIRDWTGDQSLGVGFIAYNASPRIHVDVRANGDWHKWHAGALQNAGVRHA